MNIRAQISVATDPVVIPLPTARPRPPAEGFVAPVAERASALFFDVPPTAGRRLTAEADGVPLPGPLAATSVPLRSGGRRHVLLSGQGTDALARRRLVLALDGAAAAVIDPAWLQSPLVDVAALFEGVTDDGRQRLLRLFLTTGASLLGRGSAGFAPAARRLLTLLAVRQLAPLGWCRLGAAARIVSYRLPRGFAADGQIGAFVALAGTVLARVAGDPATVESRPEGALLHVLVAASLPADAELVALGPVPLVLRQPTGGARPIERWLAARDAATRAWAERRLVAAAATDPVAHATVRELRHRTDSPPALRVGHLSGTPAGMLHALALHDPHDLVRAVRISRGSAEAAIGVDAVAGYAALPRSSSIDDRYRLALVYHSGRTVTVAEGRLPRFDGAVPAGPAPAAVAEARLDREPAGRVLRLETFGPALPDPRLTVIAPVAACLELIRLRAALACAEADGGTVEFLYHASDGAESRAAASLLPQVAAAFGLPHRLLVAMPDLAPADRVAAAVQAASAPRLLLLGGAVAPGGPGWIAPWRRLSARHPMLAAAVAGHDGRPETEPGVDCLGLLRETALALLPTATAYPGADMLLLEAAERLRQGGTPPARLGLVFVRYDERPLTMREKSVDAAALALILKRSFSNACDEVAP